MIDEVELETFATLFVGRRSDYALQRETGRYLRVGVRLTWGALRRHLAGAETIGTYVIDERGLCHVAVFDADRADGLFTLKEVQDALAHDGVPSYLELSRRGGHLWVVLSDSLPASSLRRWLLPYCPAEVEFYPKQDELGKGGYGSLVRLPLGVHRLTGRRYPFVTWQGGHLELAASSTSATLVWFATMQRAVVPASVLSQPTSTRPTAGGVTAPSLAKAHAPALSCSLSTIHAWCDTQDPFAAIGRYVQLDRRGLGCCPFGEHHADGRDSHPSLRVYAPRSVGGSCWYCYVWRRGGNVFDFLCLYHHQDAKTLWHRVLAGEVF
jgi:hypothetical protein